MSPILFISVCRERVGGEHVRRSSSGGRILRRSVTEVVAGREAAAVAHLIVATSCPSRSVVGPAKPAFEAAVVVIRFLVAGIYGHGVDRGVADKAWRLRHLTLYRAKPEQLIPLDRATGRSAELL